LGGQHIAAALRETYIKLQQSNVEVSRYLQEVKALVLKPGTPRRIAQLAAGHHQALQSSSLQVKLVDVCRSLGDASAEKKLAGGSGTLTDEQLYVVLVCHGLHGQSTTRPTPPGEVTSETAYAAQQTAVCFPL